MKSSTKIIITIAVFAFVIVYFIKGNNNEVVVKGDTECDRLNEILKVRIQDYFQDKLPIEDGIMVSEDINKLIESKVITSKDLREVGTSCSGSVYVGKSNSKYYYSNDVTCGSCSIDSLYDVWSEYAFNEPTTSLLDKQVQLDLYYNYSDATPDYTEWTEWVSKDDTKTIPVLPSGVTALDTETEEKTQYSYRDGSFKWYKTTGGGSYYNNGAYSETSPGSGYEPVEQKVSRTTNTSANKSDILSQVSGRKYKLIETPQYRESTPKYIYSRTINTTQCEVANKTCHYPVTNYRCYREIAGSTSYTCTKTTTISKDCFTQDYNTAYQTCIYDGGQTCSVTTCPGSTSGGIYSYTANFTLNNASGYECTVKCSGLSVNPGSSCSTSAIKTCLLASNYGGSVTYNKCKKSGNSDRSVCWSSSSCDFRVEGMGINTCHSGSSSSSGGTTTPTTYGYSGSSTQTLYNQSYPLSGYSCSASTTNTQKVYMSGTVATSGSCPSSYPKSEAVTTTLTKTVNTCGSECIGGCDEGTCTKYKTQTTYIKDRNGATTTNRSEAMYFTEEEYKKYIGNSNYTPEATSAQNNWSDWKNGNCTNNITTSTCEQRILYSAEIYTYKWIKSSTASKSYWEGGEYSNTSPGSGYKVDTSSAKWGNWTDYQDEKVDATDTRQVRTQTLKRTRSSYVKEGSLKLEKYLPISEFETKVGKTLNEMLLDKSLSVQKKVVYKFRTFKES